MERVVILAPDNNFARIARGVVNRYPMLEVKVLTGALEQGVEVFKKQAPPDTKVAISRGGTAFALRETIPHIQVINVRITPYDIIRSLHVAKKYSKKIVIAGFTNIEEAVGGVGGILEEIFEIELLKIVVELKKQEDLKSAFQNAVEKGFNVIVGGSAVIKIAKSLGLRGVLLSSGEETVLHSLQEAHRLLEAIKREKERINQLNAILASTCDGILAIDEGGKITVLNPVVERIAGIKAGESLGRHLKEVLPSLRLLSVLDSGAKQLGIVERLGNKEVAANEVPILVDGRAIGAVATFQEVHKLQTIEQNVRRALSAKGHTAKHSFNDIVGESHALKAAIAKAEQFAKLNSTVLIVGETGSGKEIFAQSIHLANEGKDKPFVGVNCAAIPETLLESELFGYVEGAFTGARRGGKQGLFEQAHGGTLFLDEISEMPLFLQARLLRVLQEKEIMCIGDNRIIPIDVRIIAATNRNLKRMVEGGGFREDLYYRLNVLRLKIPPLRERKEDISLLLKHFLIKKTGYLWEIDMSAIRFLLQLEWPGNVRQLENLAERLSLICQEGKVSLEQVRSALDDEDFSPVAFQEQATLAVLQLNEVRRVLKETRGCKSEAAKRLGVSTTTLWRWLKKGGEMGG